jgi:hypothetical protein
MADKTRIEFKNIGKDPQGYFVGYLKGKRKKYVEQEKRFTTPEEALDALGIPIFKVYVTDALKRKSNHG